MVQSAQRELMAVLSADPAKIWCVFNFVHFQNYVNTEDSLCQLVKLLVGSSKITYFYTESRITLRIAAASFLHLPPQYFLRYLALSSLTPTVFGNRG